MSQYASPVEIAQVEQLQKEIHVLVKKIHNPFYSFLAVLVIPKVIMYILKYICASFTSWEETLVALKATLKPNEFKIFEDYNQAKRKLDDFKSFAQASLHSGNQMQLDVMRVQMQPLIENFKRLRKQMLPLLNNPEVVRLSAQFLFDADQPFFKKVQILNATIGFPLIKFLFRYFHQKLVQYLPFGILQIHSHYRNTQSLDAMEPYPLMQVRADSNNQKKNSLIELKNKLLSVHKILRNFSRIFILGVLTYYLVSPFKFFELGAYLVSGFFSLLPTALSNLLTDPIDAYRKRKADQQTEKQLSELNKLSNALGLETWQFQKEAEYSSSFFILNIKNKKNSKALQNAFQRNNIELLAWSNNQIILDKSVDLNSQIIQKIIAAYEEEVALQNKPNDFLTNVSEEKEHSTSIHHLSERQTKPRKRNSTRVVMSKLEEAPIQDKKTETAPIIINFGVHGIYNSEDKHCKIKLLHSHFWPKNTHFGIMTVDAKKFDNESLYDKYQSILHGGQVVAPSAQQGIVKADERIRLKNRWRKAFFKIKSPTKDARVFQTEPPIQVNNAHLHVFNYLPPKAHR